MQKLLKDPIILSDYYYAPAKKPETLLEFSYVNQQIPDLVFSEDQVRVVFSPTEALYFQDPEKVKETRFIYTKLRVDGAQEILFSTISHSNYKIWLNGLYVGASTGFDLFTFYLNFQPGDNILVFEVDLANPNYYDFNNRVVLQSEEEKIPIPSFAEPVWNMKNGFSFSRPRIVENLIVPAYSFPGVIGSFNPLRFRCWTILEICFLGFLQNPESRCSFSRKN